MRVAWSLLHRVDMDERHGSALGLVTGRIGLGTDASATGTNVAAFDRPVEYEGFQAEGTRHAWTLEADGEGRYHALTLRQESNDGSWEVTADQPFDGQDEARAWATRLYEETE